MHDVFIAAVARTPLGGFNGSLASLSCTDLGSAAIKEVIKRSGVQPSQIQEVYYGTVLAANLGQNPARVASIHAGIPNNVPCTTVNAVCASGMKALTLGAQSIQLGQSDIVLVGGQESMTNTPYYLPKARFGSKYGHQEMVDGIVADGLYDIYNKFLMGVAGEICAKEFKFTREQQDDYAIAGYKKAQEATKNGKFKEMFPIDISNRGKVTTVSQDDEVANFNESKLRSVKPAFQPQDGTVTAPNSSPLSDGACAIILISGEAAKKYNIPVVARIRGFADAAREPERFTIAPALAIPLALQRAGVTKEQVDFYEINEAFSVVALANMQLLNLDAKKVNVYGGAVSMGHPLGCSGARIVATLVSVLQQENGKIGVAAVCAGGGQASAVVIEKVN